MGPLEAVTNRTKITGGGVPQIILVQEIGRPDLLVLERLLVGHPGSQVVHFLDAAYLFPAKTPPKKQQQPEHSNKRGPGSGRILTTNSSCLPYLEIRFRVVPSKRPP